MKKKFIMIFILIILATSAYSAAEFNILVGANASYQLGTAEQYNKYINTTNTEFSKLTPFEFGLITRMQLWYLDLGLDFFIQQGPGLQSNNLGFDQVGRVGIYVGPVFDLFEFMKIGFGVGAKASVPFNKDGTLSTLQANGTYERVSSSKEIILDHLKNATLYYRVGLGFYYGMFNIMVDYVADTTFTLTSKEPEKLKPEFKTSRIGITIGLSLL